MRCRRMEAPMEQKNGGLLMGLRGIWLQIAQLGALGVILVVFYQDRHASLDQAREDRLMFREELSAFRHEHRELQKVVTDNTSAIRELAREFRKKGEQ